MSTQQHEQHPPARDRVLHVLPTGEHSAQLCPPGCSEQHHQHAAMRILGPEGERIDIVHDLQARHQLFDLQGISRLSPVQIEVRLPLQE